MIGDRIKSARLDAKMNQPQLAACIGVTKSTVAQWENGDIKSLKGENVLKAADCLGVAAEWLQYGTGPKHLIRETAPAYLKGGRSVPLISWRQAAHWPDSTNDKEAEMYKEWMNCPVPCSQQTYALKVQGISMEPEVRDGEIIFVDPEVTPEHGDLVIARTADGEATFKKLIIEGGQMLLTAVNPDWPGKLTPADENTICGVVIFQGRSRR